jgi:hypothetical protein
MRIGKLILSIINVLIILTFLFISTFFFKNNIFLGEVFLLVFIFLPLFIPTILLFLFKKGPKLKNPNLCMNFNLIYLCSTIILIFSTIAIIFSGLVFFIITLFTLIFVSFLIFKYKSYFNSLFYIVLGIILILFLFYLITFPWNRSIDIFSSLEDYSFDENLADLNEEESFSFLKNYSKEEMKIVKTIGTFGPAFNCGYSRNVIRTGILELPKISEQEGLLIGGACSAVYSSVDECDSYLIEKERLIERRIHVTDLYYKCIKFYKQRYSREFS